MIGLLLTRWRVGLSIAAALALVGLIGALSHYRGAYHAEKALRVADRASYAAAQSIAAAKAIAALQAAEAAYRDKADDADRMHQTKLAGLAGLAGDYKQRNRVRAEAATGPSCRAVASAEDHSAAVHQEPAAAPILVGEQDFDRCTAWVAYGEAARDWALGLGE